jgi:hypothetical protein
VFVKFQFGRHRALRGRGWRGLLALGFLLITCVTTATGSSWIVSPLRAAEDISLDDCGARHAPMRLFRRAFLARSHRFPASLSRAFVV